MDTPVIKKPTKEFVDASGQRKVKANMDVELAVTAMQMAERIDEMVLFSGDGDFRSLIEAIATRLTCVRVPCSDRARVALHTLDNATNLINLQPLRR